MDAVLGGLRYAQMGLVVGVGYTGAVSALGGVFDEKPSPGARVAIVGGHHVVGLVIVGIILDAWM